MPDGVKKKGEAPGDPWLHLGQSGKQKKNEGTLRTGRGGSEKNATTHKLWEYREKNKARWGEIVTFGYKINRKNRQCFGKSHEKHVYFPGGATMGRECLQKPGPRHHKVREEK